MSSITKILIRNILASITCAAFFTSGAFSQNASIPTSFLEIDASPKVISFRNRLEVNNQGGHLQGVQSMEYNGQEYAVVTGSSSTYAYYSVAKVANQSEVISINTLMRRPFKHAGGFQIFRDLMVVGIEDNDARDQSRVCIYEIADPEEPPIQPLSLIERKGEPSRSTAGCTGITVIGRQVLLVVGDWDTRHLDFYLCEEQQLRQATGRFEKVYTIDTDGMDKRAWSDQEWHAYQNINLLSDVDGKLYLFGFEGVIQDQNVADLFLVEESGLREFRLVKIMSRTFSCQEGASFRAGAGISVRTDGKLRIVACSPHISESLNLNVFE